MKLTISLNLVLHQTRKNYALLIEQAIPGKKLTSKGETS